MSNDNPGGGPTNEPGGNSWDSPRNDAPGAASWEQPGGTGTTGGPIGGQGGQGGGDWQGGQGGSDWQSGQGGGGGWQGPSVPPPGAGGPANQGLLITLVVLGSVFTICCLCFLWPVPLFIATIVLAAIGLARNGRQDHAGANTMQKWALGTFIAGLVVAFVVIGIGMATGGDRFDDIRSEIDRAMREATSTTMLDPFENQQP